MMLRSKWGWVRYKVVAPSAEKEWSVHPTEYVTDHQYGRMVGKPDMILELAHHIAEKYRAQGYEDVEVYAECMLHFNGRPVVPFTDTTTNLAAEKRSLSDYTWVLPLTKGEE